MDAVGRTRLFREVNVCIDELLERFGAADEAEFLCECPSAACSRLLTLARWEFERIRREGAFIVAPSCVLTALSCGTEVRYVVVPEVRAGAAAPERRARQESAARPEGPARLEAAALPEMAARTARSVRSVRPARWPGPARLRPTAPAAPAHSAPAHSAGWGAPAA
jgi:hypothetical protein